MRELQGVNKEHDNFIYETVTKMMARIVDTQDRETMRAIAEYCEENNIIPNLIDKNKLDLVLRLGIQALNLRELKGDSKQLYMKDFNGEQIFSLEYDKETLRDMVLDKQKEINDLRNIIKEVREYIEKHIAMFKNGDMLVDMNIDELLEILDKENQDVKN